MERAGSHRGAVLRWTAQIFLAICAAAVVVGGLVIASGWPPIDLFGSAVRHSLYPRGADDAPDDVKALFSLGERVPAQSVSVRLTIVQKPGPDPESTAFDVTAALSGAADNPLLTSLRAGAGRTAPRDVVAIFAGLPTVGERPPEFSAPTLWTDIGGLTATVAGTVVVPKSTGAGAIAIRAPSRCDWITTRTVTVSLTELDVVGATSSANGCRVGTWLSQSRTAVEYQGTAAVAVDLAPEAVPQRSLFVSRSSLFQAEHPVARVLQSLLYAFLTALPLIIVWRMLRRLGRSPSVLTTVATMGALLMFHTVVRAWLVAQNSIVGPVTSFTNPRLMLSGHPISFPLYDTITATLIAGIVFVWRRAALVSAGGAGPLPSRPIGRLSGFSALLAAIVGASVWALRETGGSPRPGDWDRWLHGWPGLVATGLASATLIGAASAGVLRRVIPRNVSQTNARNPRRGWSPFWLAALAAALIGLVQLIGHVSVRGEYDTWADRNLVPDWLSWSTSPWGWFTLVVVLAAAGSALYLGYRLRGVRVAAYLLVLLVGIAALALWVTMLDQHRPGWLAPVPGGEWWLVGPGGVFVVAGGVVVATGAAALLVAVLGGGPGLRGRAALAAAVAAALLVIRQLTEYSGPTAVILSAAVPIVAGAIVWKTLGRIGVEVLASVPAEQRLRLPGWSAFFGAGGLIAILLSVPWNVYPGSARPIDWWDFASLMLGIDACLPLFAVLLVVLVARVFGGPDTTAAHSRGSYRSLRMLGVAASVAGLLTPSATAGGLPVSFLVGWLLIETWLLPRDAIPGGHVPVGDGARKATEREVAEQARTVAELRVTAALERGLRKDLAGEGVSVADREARLVKIQALALRRRPLSNAFATFGGETPWQRACAFSLIGLLAGLPWLLLDIGALFREASGPFRVVDAAAGALLLARFAIAGFVAGLTFPMIRGRTGLAKGLALFVAIAVPAVCATLLPDPGAPGVVPAALLQVAQWLSFALVFGLAADLRQLRASGLGWRSLSDVHNLTALTASFSSVVLAAVAAAVTAIGTGAAGVVVERLLPPPPVVTTPAPVPASGK